MAPAMTTTPTTAPGWSFRHHWMSHVAAHAAMRPDATAVRFRGVGEGDRVALLTLNHPEAIGVMNARRLATWLGRRPERARERQLPESNADRVAPSS
jgi:hypothetical protein